MSDSVNIEGLDRAAVLAALYNASRPQGMGFLHYNPKPMTVEEARNLLGTEPVKDKYFDYLYGRVMKVQMGGNSINTRLYDRDIGEGAGQRVIEELRATQNINTVSIQATHRSGVKNAAAEAVKSMSTPSTFEDGVITLTLEEEKDILEPIVNRAVEVNQ